MDKSCSRSSGKPSGMNGAAAPDGNAVIRFTPGPPPPQARPDVAAARCAALSPEVTHGCVDWFDYKSHPLQHPAR
jgi:hypothetical protein